MVERIHNYFRSLGLDDEEAESLHMRYYKEYGLAIRGLVQHHAIDPLDYDQKCDASLPLEEILRAEWTFGVVTGIVVVHTVHGTLKLRCFGARPFQEELARAARRAQLAR